MYIHTGVCHGCAIGTLSHTSILYNIQFENQDQPTTSGFQRDLDINLKRLFQAPIVILLLLQTFHMLEISVFVGKLWQDHSLRAVEGARGGDDRLAGGGRLGGRGGGGGGLGGGQATGRDGSGEAGGGARGAAIGAPREDCARLGWDDRSPSSRKPTSTQSQQVHRDGDDCRFLRAHRMRNQNKRRNEKQNKLHSDQIVSRYAHL
ncbi:hypothetical protein AXG93_4831s1440 [Marchantia polymorpha subsp. ruderalis]|uniref:Uncharacterized protein n=1 Tax=Marchantia polymorpha subsp. ruderalis TaxID=1480154 RepID=A0A176W9M1_MARPO|nr:hypothetical protein AXG93_4831s1440 [Marchantia polymorpha subsp. ruderalis]